jgi:hypothetical protein
MLKVCFESPGTGNSEIILDRKLVDKRTFPAIDIQRSGTRKEELLIPKEDLQRIWVLRKVLNPLSPVEAMELLIERLAKAGSNSPVPQVRARFLGANLGPTVLRRACQVLPAHFAKAGIPHCQEPLRSSQLFSSHFSRTLITDMHHNRCEDTSTVHHRELRPSPETNAFLASNFSPLFDNIWPRPAPPQVHAKQQHSALSPIF